MYVYIYIYTCIGRPGRPPGLRRHDARGRLNETEKQQHNNTQPTNITIHSLHNKQCSATASCLTTITANHRYANAHKQARQQELTPEDVANFLEFALGDLHSAKGGAVEPGCSDLYGVIYYVTVQYYPNPLHSPPTAPPCNEYPGDGDVADLAGVPLLLCDDEESAQALCRVM